MIRLIIEINCKLTYSNKLSAIIHNDALNFRLSLRKLDRCFGEWRSYFSIRVIESKAQKHLFHEFTFIFCGLPLGKDFDGLGVFGAPVKFRLVTFCVTNPCIVFVVVRTFFDGCPVLEFVRPKQLPLEILIISRKYWLDLILFNVHLFLSYL